MAYMPVSKPPGPQTGPRDAIHDASPPPPAGPTTQHTIFTHFMQLYLFLKKSELQQSRYIIRVGCILLIYPQPYGHGSPIKTQVKLQLTP